VNESDPVKVREVEVGALELHDVVERDFKHFINLERLQVSDNALPLAPFASLPALRELVIRSNDITMLQGTGCFRALELLDLSFNSITGPALLADLAHHAPRLKYLDVSHNQLTDLRLPGGWAYFSQLRYLAASSNPLGDSVFLEVANAPMLETLVLEDCSIEELNEQTATPPRLAFLSLVRSKVGQLGTLQAFKSFPPGGCVALGDAAGSSQQNTAVFTNRQSVLRVAANWALGGAAGGRTGYVSVR